MNSTAYSQMLSLQTQALKWDKSYVNMIKKNKFDNLSDCHTKCNDMLNTITENDLEVIAKLFNNKFNVFQVFEAVKYYEDKLVKDYEYKEKKGLDFPKEINLIKEQKNKKTISKTKKTIKSKTKKTIKPVEQKTKKTIKSVIVYKKKTLDYYAELPLDVQKSIFNIYLDEKKQKKIWKNKISKVNNDIKNLKKIYDETDTKYWEQSIISTYDNPNAAFGEFVLVDYRCEDFLIDLSNNKIHNEYLKLRETISCYFDRDEDVDGPGRGPYYRYVLDRIFPQNLIPYRYIKECPILEDNYTLFDY
jgi:hypothetical protein